MPTDYRELARQKAQKYGLIPEVFERQIETESGFNPKAVSRSGAQGIAQIMPTTAKGWGVNPLDPAAALEASAKNMAGYIKTYLGGKSLSTVTDSSELRKAYEKGLRAYNAGPGAVEASKQYPETNRYVQKIIGPDKFSFSDAIRKPQPQTEQKTQNIAAAPTGNTYIIYGGDEEYGNRGFNFLRDYTKLGQPRMELKDINVLAALQEAFNPEPAKYS